MKQLSIRVKMAKVTDLQHNKFGFKLDTQVRAYDRAVMYAVKQ